MDKRIDALRGHYDDDIGVKKALHSLSNDLDKFSATYFSRRRNLGLSNQKALVRASHRANNLNSKDHVIDFYDKASAPPLPGGEHSAGMYPSL